MKLIYTMFYSLDWGELISLGNGAVFEQIDEASLSLNLSMCLPEGCCHLGKQVIQGLAHQK